MDASTLQCEICNRQVPHNNLIHHYSIHTERNDFPCKFCDQVFRQILDLNSHYQLYHKMCCQYNCPICQKKCVCIYEFFKHLHADHASKTAPSTNHSVSLKETTSSHMNLKKGVSSLSCSLSSSIKPVRKESANAKGETSPCSSSTTATPVRIISSKKRPVTRLSTKNPVKVENVSPKIVKAKTARTNNSLPIKKKTTAPVLPITYNENSLILKEPIICENLSSSGVKSIMNSVGVPNKIPLGLQITAVSKESQNSHQIIKIPVVTSKIKDRATSLEIIPVCAKQKSSNVPVTSSQSQKISKKYSPNKVSITVVSPQVSSSGKLSKTNDLKSSKGKEDRKSPIIRETVKSSPITKSSSNLKNYQSIVKLSNTNDLKILLCDKNGKSDLKSPTIQKSVKCSPINMSSSKLKNYHSNELSNANDLKIILCDKNGKADIKSPTTQKAVTPIQISSFNLKNHQPNLKLPNTNDLKIILCDNKNKADLRSPIQKAVNSTPIIMSTINLEDNQKSTNQLQLPKFPLSAILPIVKSRNSELSISLKKSSAKTQKNRMPNKIPDVNSKGAVADLVKIILPDTPSPKASYNSGNNQNIQISKVNVPLNTRNKTGESTHLLKTNNAIKYVKSSIDLKETLPVANKGTGIPGKGKKVILQQGLENPNVSGDKSNLKNVIINSETVKVTVMKDAPERKLLSLPDQKGFPYSSKDVSIIFAESDKKITKSSRKISVLNDDIKLIKKYLNGQRLQMEDSHKNNSVSPNSRGISKTAMDFHSFLPSLRLEKLPISTDYCMYNEMPPNEISSANKNSQPVAMSTEVFDMILPSTWNEESNYCDSSSKIANMNPTSGIALSKKVSSPSKEQSKQIKSQQPSSGLERFYLSTANRIDTQHLKQSKVTYGKHDTDSGKIIKKLLAKCKEKKQKKREKFFKKMETSNLTLRKRKRSGCDSPSKESKPNDSRGLNDASTGKSNECKNRRKAQKKDMCDQVRTINRENADVPLTDSSSITSDSYTMKCPCESPNCNCHSVMEVTHPVQKVSTRRSRAAVKKRVSTTPSKSKQANIHNQYMDTEVKNITNTNSNMTNKLEMLKESFSSDPKSPERLSDLPPPFDLFEFAKESSDQDSSVLFLEESNCSRLPANKAAKTIQQSNIVSPKSAKHLKKEVLPVPNAKQQYVLGTNLFMDASSLLNAKLAWDIHKKAMKDTRSNGSSNSNSSIDLSVTTNETYTISCPCGGEQCTGINHCSANDFEFVLF